MELCLTLHTNNVFQLCTIFAYRSRERSVHEIRCVHSRWWSWLVVFAILMSCRITMKPKDVILSLSSPTYYRTSECMAHPAQHGAAIRPWIMVGFVFISAAACGIFSAPFISHLVTAKLTHTAPFAQYSTAYKSSTVQLTRRMPALYGMLIRFSPHPQL